MSLPAINNIEFFTEIPSTKQEVKYRPFTVREQKALLVAKMSDSKKMLSILFLMLLGIVC